MKVKACPVRERSVCQWAKDLNVVFVKADKVNGIFLRKGNDKVTLAKYSQMRMYRVRQITSCKRLG